MLQDKETTPEEQWPYSTNTHRQCRWGYMSIGVGMSAKRVKKNYWVDDDINDEIDKVLDIADVDSRSAFVNKAIRFYIGFLKTDYAESYLLNTLSSVLHSSLDFAESRINDQLYKMSVELSMLNRIVGYGMRLTEDDIEKIRAISVEEIREIRRISEI